MSVRVALPAHLRTLARVNGEVELAVNDPVTLETVLSALEERYPVLRGSIRDHGTHKRRDFVRFFAAGEDISLQPPGLPLPGTVARGEEPLMVVGALAGG